MRFRKTTNSLTTSSSKSPTSSPLNSPTNSPTTSPSNSPSTNTLNSPTSSPLNSATNSSTTSPSYSPSDSPLNMFFYIHSYSETGGMLIYSYCTYYKTSTSNELNLHENRNTFDIMKFFIFSNFKM